MVALPNFFITRPHVAEYDFAGVVVNGNGTEFSDGNPVYGWVPSGQFSSQKHGIYPHLIVEQNCRWKINKGHWPNILVSLPRPSSNAHPISPRWRLQESRWHVWLPIRLYSTSPNLKRIRPYSSTEAAHLWVRMPSKWPKQKVLESWRLHPQRMKNLFAALGPMRYVHIENRFCVCWHKNVFLQFIDYTKMPLYSHLLQNPPSTKYNVIYDAVGVIEPSLFTYSEKYLAANGIFVSSGPMPKKISFSEAWNLMKTLFAIFTPTFLGGINRKYS